MTPQLHQPVKHEKNPILLPEYPWEGRAIFLNGSVLRPLRTGDELWIYYGSTNNSKKQRPYSGGVGVAKLRVDGFASMDAGEEEGVLITRPLVLTGKALCVNADASAGSLAVETEGKQRE